MDDLKEDRVALLHEVVAQNGTGKRVPIPAFSRRAQGILEEANTIRP
jgi:hypothetical protein